MKRSILLDSQADLLMYGMGERSLVEIADALDSGLDIKDITYVDGTAYRTPFPCGSRGNSWSVSGAASLPEGSGR